MKDKWTDRRRAAFVRYRNECQRRERRNALLYRVPLAVLGLALYALLVYALWPW